LEEIWKRTWPIAEPFCEGSGEFFVAGGTTNRGFVPGFGGIYIRNLSDGSSVLGGTFGYNRWGRRGGHAEQPNDTDPSVTLVGGLDTGDKPFSLGVVPAVPFAGGFLGPVIGLGGDRVKLGFGVTFGLFQVGIEGRLSLLGGCGG
jgi:hypothetical protein